VNAINVKTKRRQFWLLIGTLHVVAMLGCSGQTTEETDTQPVPDADASMTLTWVQPTTNSDGSTLTNLAGYKILIGKARDQYSLTVNVSSPETTSQRIALASGTYYARIVSYTSDGLESAPSEEVQKSTE
jgi:hypothetical protein